MDKIIAIIEEIRHIRTMLNMSPAKKVVVHLLTDIPETLNVLEKYSSYIQNLGKTEKLIIEQGEEKPACTATGVVGDVTVFIDMQGVDLSEEENRLSRRIDKLKQELTPIEKKLSNTGFLQKAPPEVVTKQKNKQAELTDKLGQLETNLNNIRRL